jgi:hypothetical protein
VAASVAAAAGVSSTVAEAFSSVAGDGDSSCAMADAMKLRAAIATNEMIDFIEFPFLSLRLNAGCYKTLPPTLAAIEHTVHSNLAL